MKVRLLTITSMGMDSKEAPMIRITGKWLERLGFGIGKKIMVEEKYGQLVIKVITVEEANNE
ncbi:MAG: SymE family type I addiction module toxin [Ruminiclostridium sp.]